MPSLEGIDLAWDVEFREIIFTTVGILFGAGH